MADVEIIDIEALTIYARSLSTLRDSTQYNGTNLVSFLLQKLEVLRKQLREIEEMEQKAYKEYKLAQAEKYRHLYEDVNTKEKSVLHNMNLSSKIGIEQHAYENYIKIKNIKNNAKHQFTVAKNEIRIMIDITYNYQKQINNYTETGLINLKKLVSNIEQYKELSNLIKQKENESINIDGK